MRRNNAALGTPGENPELSYQGIPLRFSQQPPGQTPSTAPEKVRFVKLWPFGPAMGSSCAHIVFLPWFLRALEKGTS